LPSGPTWKTQGDQHREQPRYTFPFEQVKHRKTHAKNMNQKERISLLEKEIVKLKVDFQEYYRNNQSLGGQTRIYELAIVALIASRPCSNLLEPDLKDSLARIDQVVIIVFVDPRVT
jgi:hypothetical protein